MAELTEGDKKLLKDIAEHGWHVLKIMEDETGPGFCYSVGLFETFGHPEIIIVGLKPDLAHILINNIGEDIRSGKVYRSGKYYEGILDDFKCFLLEVSKENYKEHFGYAHWYYKGDKFPVLQCIYPTTSGVFPWEDSWPENIKDLQPILGESLNRE